MAKAQQRRDEKFAHKKIKKDEFDEKHPDKFIKRLINKEYQIIYGKK